MKYIGLNLNRIKIL